MKLPDPSITGRHLHLGVIDTPQHAYTPHQLAGWHTPTLTLRKTDSSSSCME